MDLVSKSNRQLRDDSLKDLWSNLRHIWLFDKSFEIPTEDELNQGVEVVKTMPIEMPGGNIITLDNLYNSGDVWDCDDFSMLSAVLIRLWWKSQGKKLPIPYGRVMGNQFRGMAMLHALNICITQQGVFFIDFDDRGRIWKASPEYDSIFFVSI